MTYQIIYEPSPPSGSKEEKLEYYRKTYQKFLDMSEDEIQNRWRRLFKNCKYEKNGNFQQSKVDCSGALYILLRELGANIMSETVENIEKRTKKIAYKYPEIIKKTKRTIKPKDVILFKYKNGTRHCGIVYAVKGNYIQYMDFNIKTGEAQKEVWWKDKSITTIAQISFKFWIGDLLKP